MKAQIIILLLLFNVKSECQTILDSLSWNIEADLIQLLPSGRIEVDVMGFQKPSGYNELIQKIRTGIALHQDWYIEYIKTMESSQSDNYHPNLGVTEDEWKTLLVMMDQMEMVKIGVGYLDVIQSDSTIELKGYDETESFNGLKINLMTKMISTPYDSWNFTKTIQSNSGQALTGMWDGYNWKYQEMDTTNLTNLTKLKGKDYDFSIGQLVKSKRGIIFFKAREFSEGQQYSMADLLITYDIPKNKN